MSEMNDSVRTEIYNLLPEWFIKLSPNWQEVIDELSEEDCYLSVDSMRDVLNNRYVVLVTEFCCDPCAVSIMGASTRKDLEEKLENELGDMNYADMQSYDEDYKLAWMYDTWSGHKLKYQLQLLHA